MLSGYVAGKDATEAFFSLHRYEVLQKPQYRGLQVGSIQGAVQQILPREPGALSQVPYSEPTWLTQGYHSPYYQDVRIPLVLHVANIADSRIRRVIQHHRKFQLVMRKFTDEILYPDAQALQETGKKPSQKVFDEIAKLNVHAMRLGPGKHLKGRTLAYGAVKPEEVRSDCVFWKYV